MCVLVRDLCVDGKEASEFIKEEGIFDTERLRASQQILCSLELVTTKF
jgi:hypothetical protein